MMEESEELYCEESQEFEVYHDSESGQLHLNELPDSIFLQIFNYLPFTALGRVPQVCRRWRQISKDDLLWKSIFLAHFKLPSSTILAPGAKSWKSEFKRLQDRIPCVLSEERKEHRDEVLHVSFSHDGTMFATCSKDGFFKVWKSTHPSRLLFEKNMMYLFSWKYTQFSQFNETDTCVLVSGVYFGGLSRSGEIAIFDVQGDFRMQCRVNNKPYDVFGAWYDNNHLLSGTLYVTGDFASVSAIWLNKASQEVESEVESVSMVLYRFTNVNASAIRLLNVAEVDTEQCEEDAKRLSRPPSSDSAQVDCAKHIPRRTSPCNAVPSDLSSNPLQKPFAGDECDLTDEDESDDDFEIDGSNGGEKRSKNLEWLDSGQLVDNCLPNFSSDLSSSLCARNYFSNLLEPCDMHSDSDKKDAPANPSTIVASSKLLPSAADCVTASNSKASGKEIKDLSRNLTSSHNCPSTLHNVTQCSKSDNSSGQPDVSKDTEEGATNEVSFSLCMRDSEAMDFPGGSGNCCSSEISSTHRRIDSEERLSDFMDCKASDVSNNCDSDFMSKGVAGLEKEGKGNKQMDTGTQTEGTLSQASSFQSLSHMSHSSSLSNELCKSPREKLLIYTWGTETYIPHKIGIKRMKPSDFCKGSRQASMLLPDVMDNLQNVSGSRRDVPDVSLDMHGYIVGLGLSPDQRYLYINCRSWPKDCIITDPLASLPLAQEVEIFTVDLMTFQLTGPVLRSHKAYTDAERCFFLNLDVSDHYVVSGAEDRRGYLWDRHYGIPLCHFDHRDVVSGVAINPRNSEMAVSVSDDHTFKVWISRRKARKYRRKKISFGHVTHRESPV